MYGKQHHCHTYSGRHLARHSKAIQHISTSLGKSHGHIIMLRAGYNTIRCAAAHGIGTGCGITGSDYTLPLLPYVRGRNNRTFNTDKAQEEDSLMHTDCPHC